MKKIIYLFALIFVGFSSESQILNNNPNSNWPYLLQEFSSCIIIHKDGNVTKAKANYNLLNEEIQFQKNDKIMSVIKPVDIKEISFDDYKMVNIQNNFYISLNKRGDVINIFKKMKGNMNDLHETKGAYGSSTTTAATMQKADIDIGGINNMDIRMLWDNKSDGKKFRVNENYFFTTPPTNNELITLKKRNLYDSLATREKAIKTFLKNEKIRLKDDEDLKKLANYLNGL